MRSLSMLSLAAALLLPLDAAAQAGSPTPGQVRVRRSEAAASSGWFGLGFACAANCDGPASRSDTAPAVIARILPGGPADRASLAAGDTILTLGGRRVSGRDVQAALAATRPGSALEMLVGTRRGRFTYRIRKQADSLHDAGGAALPIRYQGEFAGVGVEVLTRDTPVITRDSAGAMLIAVGGHVVRLRPAPAGVGHAASGR